MYRESPEAHRAPSLLLVILAAICLLTPSSALVAKTLASEALAAAIETGTLDQVAQEMMMDLYQKQKFDFDETGMEALGRDLVAQGRQKQAIEVLQLNQMINLDSPGAANALGDAYRDSGDDIAARLFYDMALNLDPESEHARKATAEQGDAQDLAMGTMGDQELDPAAMQAALAQSGVEMTPEQMQKMQQAMAQMEAYQQEPDGHRATEEQRASSQSEATRQTSSTQVQPAQESEFCEVLHRFNAEKRIEDAQIRARVEGRYAISGESNRSWNVETACGEFLVAVPLWADVSPPVMTPTSENSFEDAVGGTWEFLMDGSDKAESVTYTASDGSTSKMQRLGDPVSFD